MSKPEPDGYEQLQRQSIANLLTMSNQASEQLRGAAMGVARLDVGLVLQSQVLVMRCLAFLLDEQLAHAGKGRELKVRPTEKSNGGDGPPMVEVP